MRVGRRKRKTCGGFDGPFHGSEGTLGGGGGGGCGDEGGVLWSAGGVSFAVGPSPPLAGGAPAAGAPGRFVPGAGPIGLPAVRGAVLPACSLRASRARVCLRSGPAPSTWAAADFRRVPRRVAESRAAIDSERRFFLGRAGVSPGRNSRRTGGRRASTGARR